MLAMWRKRETKNRLYMKWILSGTASFWSSGEAPAPVVALLYNWQHWSYFQSHLTTHSLYVMMPKLGNIAVIFLQIFVGSFGKSFIRSNKTKIW